MKVLLLAAGQSKRMKPVEDKNFLNFLGKPLLQRQLETLKEVGLSEVIIVGGAHNLDKIEALGHELEMKIEIVEQKEINGMHGAVLAARDLLEQEVLVVSGNDVVEGSAFESVLKAAESGDANSYIIGKKVEKYFPGGYLEMNADGFIQKIIEKPEPGSEPSDMINLVIHLHKDVPALIEELEKSESAKDDRYEVALTNQIESGKKMKAVPYSGFWQAVKFPWHIQPLFEHYFAQAEKKISDKAVVAESAVINGEVIIEDDVKVLDGAVLKGPVYVGRASVIATGALVRDSHIGEDCVIGFASEVARSYVGDGVWTHSNYVGDSVIGNNVSFGAGTVTGNLRLDEENVLVDCDDKKIDCGSEKFGLVTGDNVRVGINTSFMPGVKIGSDSFIGAGITVAENIAEKSYVRGEFKLKISENKKKIEPRKK